MATTKKKKKPVRYEQVIDPNAKPYRPRKQVVEELHKKGEINDIEATQLNNAVIVADNDKLRGKYFLKLDKFVGSQKKELQKRIDNGTLSEKQKKLVHTLQVHQIVKPYLNNSYSIAKAIDDYFTISLESDNRPTINGLSLALGISKKDLFDICNGKRVYITGTQVCGVEEIKSAIQVIATMNEIDIAESGGMGSMFLAKNFFGLTDKKEMEITDKRDDTTTQELDDKYKDVDIIDVD